MKRAFILAAVVATIALFFITGLHERLTLQGIQASLGQLTALREASPVQTAMLFMAAYIAATALSLPGASILTLAAGALFGLVWGTVIVSFASSIGALPFRDEIAPLGSVTNSYPRCTALAACSKP